MTHDESIDHRAVGKRGGQTRVQVRISGGTIFNGNAPPCTHQGCSSPLDQGSSSSAWSQGIHCTHKIALLPWKFAPVIAFLGHLIDGAVKLDRAWWRIRR